MKLKLDLTEFVTIYSRRIGFWTKVRVGYWLTATGRRSWYSVVDADRATNISMDDAIALIARLNAGRGLWQQPKQLTVPKEAQT